MIKRILEALNVRVFGVTVEALTEQVYDSSEALVNAYVKLDQRTRYFQNELNDAYERLAAIDTVTDVVKGIAQGDDYRLVVEHEDEQPLLEEGE